MNLYLQKSIISTDTAENGFSPGVCQISLILANFCRKSNPSLTLFVQTRAIAELADVIRPRAELLVVEGKLLHGLESEIRRFADLLYESRVVRR